jgi:hypothetical protein
MKTLKSSAIIFGLAVLAIVILFGLIQLIPYGRNHTNPPVVSEPAWDPATRAIAQKACFDCHSNETVWPWYSNIAPASWLAQYDTDQGRRKLNFSEWPPREAGEISEVLAEGEMPPFQYLLMHPQAQLSAAERQALIQFFGK